MPDIDNISNFITSSQQPCLIKGILSEETLSNILDTLYFDLALLNEDTLVVPDIDTQTLQNIKDFIQLTPYGKTKLVVINLTGVSSSAQSSLLSVLDNPPGYAKIVIFSESWVINTCISRCQVLRVFDNTDSTVESKTKVLKVLASTALSEKKLLRDSMVSWAASDTKLLKIWCYESISKRFQIFSSIDVEGLGLGNTFAWSLLEALETLKFADEKRVVTSLLMAYIVSQKGIK
jgi:hypothetical protein